mgnify:CR=1 FL=1
MKRELIGEFIGTAILVFFGCGSVAAAVLFDSFDGLFQIAMVWCFGVTLAIYASRTLSPAHLNPAVSLAMLLAKKINSKRFLLFSLEILTFLILELLNGSKMTLKPSEILWRKLFDLGK